MLVIECRNLKNLTVAEASIGVFFLGWVEVQINNLVAPTLKLRLEGGPLLLHIRRDIGDRAAKEFAKTCKLITTEFLSQA